MALSIFNFTPSKAFSKSAKTRVITAQFGDGYSQRIPDGINSVVREWNISFNNNSIIQINSIEDFFNLHKGSTPFLWIPPGESVQYTVICPEWTRTYNSHLSATISAKFTQVFDAG